MYREVLLEHYKNPVNYGSIEDADVSYEDKNPLCGDVVKYYLKLKNETVKEAKFEGKGCVICMASASLLSEELIDKEVEEITSMGREEVLDMINLELTPTRVKCAVLPLMAVKKGLLEYRKVKE